MPKRTWRCYQETVKIRGERPCHSELKSDHLPLDLPLTCSVLEGKHYLEIERPRNPQQGIQAVSYTHLTLPTILRV